jgi:hypothetical protein
VVQRTSDGRLVDGSARANCLFGEWEMSDNRDASHSCGKLLPEWQVLM